MPFKLSVSAANCWQNCNREFYFKYVLKRESKDVAPELKFGKAWHSFREGKTETFGLTGAELVKLRVLDECYRKHWKDDPLDVIAVEEEFALPGFDGNGLAPDLLVCGRIDGRGASRLVEYKTTSSYLDPSSLYWERVLDDRQIQTYLGAMWSQGHTFNDVLYDVARKPGLKRKAKETLEMYGDRIREAITEDPDAYFQRRTFTFTEEQVAETWTDLYSIYKQIPETTTKLDFPRAPKSCHGYGRACSYLDVCRGAALISDDRLFQVRKHG